MTAADYTADICQNQTEEDRNCGAMDTSLGQTADFIGNPGSDTDDNKKPQLIRF